jgi:hypothetical protein
MTPGRLVSLDALSGITVAAKFRIESSSLGGDPVTPRNRPARRAVDQRQTTF